MNDGLRVLRDDFSAAPAGSPALQGRATAAATCHRQLARTRRWSATLRPLPPRTRRRGISLIELLAVITTASVILSGLGVCLHGMYRVEQRTRQRVAQRTAWSQAALLLRSDAHSAGQADLATAPDGQPAGGLTLTLGDGRRVQYGFDGRQLQRTVLRDGQRVHNDAFRLPGLQVTWTLRRDGDQTRVTMTGRPRSEPGVPAGALEAEERIDAVVRLPAAAGRKPAAGGDG